MARLIVSLLPVHRVYIEPFAGSLAVLFAKAPAAHEIVNDLDGALVTFFRVLRERPAELEAACWLTPYARAEYEAADLDAEDLDDLELARRFWVRVNQSFAKTAGDRTGWSVTTARTQSTAASVLGRIARFQRCAERLARVSIESCDAAELVERLATPDTVVYADPPYLLDGRVCRSSGHRDYRFDMGDEESHRRLAGVLVTTPAMVILSGYPTPFYEELYERAGWWWRDVATMAHSSNAATTARSTRTERLWSNRPLDRIQETLFTPPLASQAVAPSPGRPQIDGEPRSGGALDDCLAVSAPTQGCPWIEASETGVG